MSMEVLHTEERPWGKYEVLLQDTNVQIKRITVRDMEMLSLQTHEHRDEYWFVTSGQGVITIDDHRQPIAPGMNFTILRGEKHRVQALSGDLVFIEVQSGSYLGEDDIVRYEDKYGR
jgi:mannose-6-phosphate isomerase-like protein (cupin superfamily)